RWRGAARPTSCTPRGYRGGAGGGSGGSSPPESAELPVGGGAGNPARSGQSFCPDPLVTGGTISSYAGLTMTGAPPLIPTWPRSLTRDPHIRPAIRDRP